MAIMKTIETVQGFIANNAYHRVESVLLTSKDQISFHVRSYVSKEKPFFTEQIFIAAYAIDGENPIKQAYEYIKTLSEFANAVDC
jgi:hypothetical protein